MDIRNCSIIALRIPRIIAARAPEKKKQQNDLQDSEHLVQLFRYLCPKSSVIYRNRSVVFTEHFDSLGQIRLCASMYVKADHCTMYRQHLMFGIAASLGGTIKSFHSRGPDTAATQGVVEEH